MLISSSNAVILLLFADADSVCLLPLGKEFVRVQGWTAAVSLMCACSAVKALNPCCMNRTISMRVLTLMA